MTRPNMVRPKIRFREGKIQGYGGPDVYWVEATWNNTLLDRRELGSGIERQSALAELRREWDREWTSAKFASAVRGKPQASDLCSHCGGDTIDGVIYCVEKVFCRKCEPFIEGYKQLYREVTEQRRREYDEQDERRRRVAEERRDAVIGRFCRQM